MDKGFKYGCLRYDVFVPLNHRVSLYIGKGGGGYWTETARPFPRCGER